MQPKSLQANATQQANPASHFPRPFPFVDQNYLKKRNLQFFISGNHLEILGVDPKSGSNPAG